MRTDDDGNRIDDGADRMGGDRTAGDETYADERRTERWSPVEGRERHDDWNDTGDREGRTDEPGRLGEDRGVDEDGHRVDEDGHRVDGR